MTTYSAFFSSGLLAPRHASYASFNDVLNKDSYPYYDAPSPATPSSPLPDSDIELDTDREITPTPDPRPPSRSTGTSHARTPSSASTNSTQAQPRLRKRRSSLTIATSPMNSIRSPQRTAGAALQLHMHLPNPARSRSGSLSTAAAAPAETQGTGNVASEGTKLMGRMRSGSVGAALRPRRGVRRLASVPAPAPPPTAPLPALPTFLLSPSWSGPHTAPLAGAFPQTPVRCSLDAPAMNNNTKLEARPPLAPRTFSAESVPSARGRERSFSLSQGLRIDEEMKEN
ncbi:hypothetical protein LshimejAT787_1001010 [Lyophyllum shimeji]|uniref:Uncharacterized protein n=1 Tax=Lyophyllum shimeji TaxID=47721 RepID=A0A9P3UST0_LYOSH|nr:hypothetical protein LshimejAT787_1001010 [Lyophyllum shimeji]